MIAAIALNPFDNCPYKSLFSLLWENNKGILYFTGAKMK
jgi:hypothetical protein